jgi:hypothetical protein
MHVHHLDIVFTDAPPALHRLLARLHQLGEVQRLRFEGNAACLAVSSTFTFERLAQSIERLVDVLAVDRTGETCHWPEPTQPAAFDIDGLAAFSTSASEGSARSFVER